MLNHDQVLSIQAINLLYQSSIAHVLGDQDYIACNMCLSSEGNLLLSCIKSEHAHGVLIVLKNDTHELQITGSSRLVEASSELVEHYIKYFPNTLRLDLVEIVPEKYLIKDKSDQEHEIKQLNLINTFRGEIEDRMTEHMNDDHTDAMRDYCHYASIELGEEAPLMLGVDPYGFNLLVKQKPVRFQFDDKCESPQQVREALVDLAKQARS